jgi:Lrp/AsnC family leucine-responsive transcriptional regulator
MIDDISLKILKILQEKARIPNVEVARQVGMAPSAVLERIRKLEQQGYIDGYEVRLNPERFARPLVAFIYVGVDGHDPQGAIAQALTDLAESQEVHFIAGEDCYLVKVRVSTPLALGALVRQQIAAIPGVRRTRTAVALATMKETWRIPLEALP